MNEYAVLLEGFDHLSYPLGECEAKDKHSFSERKEKFVLHRVESKTIARMAIGACDWLSEHSCMPVGFVGDEKGETFVVCKTEGHCLDFGSMADEEKLEFSAAIVRRLASLHSQGFGCGGLSPEAVVFSANEARISNPARIFALTESDSLFYEAVATLRAIVGGGLAKRKDLVSLAFIYVSESPVCRHGVVSHLSKKGQKGSPAILLSEHASRLLAYF